MLFATATGGLLVGWWKRLGQLKAGFYAALMWLTCLQTLIHGRMAVADMSMVFFVVLAGWAAWEMTRQDQVEAWWWRGVFAVSLALGFLAKGPISWLPLAGVGVAMWRRPQEFVRTRGGRCFFS